MLLKTVILMLILVCWGIQQSAHAQQDAVSNQPAAFENPFRTRIPFSQFYTATQSGSRVKAVLSCSVSSPETTSGVLKDFALVPPDTETQKLVSCTIQCREFPQIQPSPVSDTKDPNRRYLLLEIPLTRTTLSRPLTFDITYIVDLIKVGLQPGSHPPEPLKKWETETDLMATPTINYSDPAFQQYLKRSGLLKLPTESNFEFAYRVYRAVSAELAVRVRPEGPAVGFDNMKASVVCQNSMHDGGCGCCSILYTGILRANGIPSRLLVGRWAKDTEGDYGQYHVRTDFYDPTVGWIPVDPTFGFGATRDQRDPNLNFGLNIADFLTFHLNSDLSPKGSEAATRWIRVHQFGIMLYEGKAPYNAHFGKETWKVTSL